MLGSRPAIAAHRLVAAAGLLAILNGPSFGAEPPAGAQTPTRSALPETPLRVPLRFVEGRPVLDVRINGQGPFSVIFDTGAETVFIDRALAEELALETEGTSMVGAPGAPQTVAVEEHTIRSVEIGGATFEGLGAMSHDEAMMTQALGDERGAIGLPTFADCLVTVDYPAGELVIRRGALAEGDGSIPYRIDAYGMPSITIDVGGVEIDGHIDSGSMGGITLPGRLETELSLSSPVHVIGRGMTPGGEFEIRRATLDGIVSIAGQRLEDPDLYFNDMFDHANVGSVVLSQFAVTIDQRSRRVRFAAPAGRTPVIRPARRPTYGIMLGRSLAGPMVISGTVPGGIAERAGLREGDVIVALNGDRVDQLDMSARGAALRGSPVRLTIERDGQRLEIEMAHDAEAGDGR